MRRQVSAGAMRASEGWGRGRPGGRNLENSSERRRFTRYQGTLAVQLRAEGQAFSTSCEAIDMSLSSCYVKMLFPLPVGTAVDIRIGMDGREAKAKGLVKTSDPALGNGIEFTEMASSCQQELEQFLQTLPEAGTDSVIIP